MQDRSEEIAGWARHCTVHVTVSERVTERAHEFIRVGLDPLDAAHLASAEVAGCDRFLTCDDRLRRRARRVALRLTVQGPVEYMEEQSRA